MKKKLYEKPYHMAEGPAVPEEVLRGLREIIPTADCLWLPGSSSRGLLYVFGYWRSADRRHAAMADIILDKEDGKPLTKKNAAAVRWARYVKFGFRPIFGVHGRVPNMADVEEFRERDSRYRHNLNGELKQRERDALGEDRRAKLDAEYRDHIRQFAIEEYPYIMREKRNVPFNGYARRFGTRWRKPNGKDNRPAQNPYKRIFDKEKMT